jgi:hypothetical protein
MGLGGRVQTGDAVNAQLTLFAPDVELEPIEPEVEFKPKLGGGPPGVQRRFQLAFTEPVKLELLAVAASRPDDWLQWNDFRAVMERHQIGFCMGHVLFHLVREGRLQEKIVYLGRGIEAERPGSPDYQGYRTEWRAA